MAITVQRSVTFPPIRLKRIDDYVLYVAKNSPSVNQLREIGLEIGRGRGDITRFLERIGVVETGGGVVSLTKLGGRLVSLREELGLAVYHALFYKRVPQYMYLVDSLKEAIEIKQEELYNYVNEKISKISPTAWVNRVAFKTLSHIAEELGVVEKLNSLLRYRGDPVEASIEAYYREHGVKIGQFFYVSLDKVIVEQCAKFEQPQSLYKIEIDCVVNKIYEIFSI
ncbi:MAG: hypothetical protein QXY12_02175 [Pyrobaculum sp.]